MLYLKCLGVYVDLVRAWILRLESWKAFVELRFDDCVGVEDVTCLSELNPENW